MNVRDNTAARDGGADERVQLLVTTDGQLKMARRCGRKKMILVSTQAQGLHY